MDDKWTMGVDEIETLLRSAPVRRTLHVGQPSPRPRAHGLVGSEYQPGLGPTPCSGPEQAPQRIARWLWHEFRNRLDAPDRPRMRAAIADCARLARSDLWGKSVPEMRAAIEEVLRAHSLPPISREFAAHNRRVNARCVEALRRLRDEGEQMGIETWLVLLAGANLLELWPSVPLPSVEQIVDLARQCCAMGTAAFRRIARHIDQRVSKGRPIALFTDNHGEVAFDLAFVRSLRARGVPCVVLAKSCPAETDVDQATALRLWQDVVGAPADAAVLPSGSRVQGNLLTRLSDGCVDALVGLRRAGGLVVSKGVANLATVPGLEVETVQLLIVKGKRVAEATGLEVGSAVGIHLPPGERPDGHGAELAATHLDLGPLAYLARGALSS